MQEGLFQWSLILSPVFLITDITILANSVHSFWEKRIFSSDFRKQRRATSKRKHQQSLSSFSRPKTLDLRFFSSPCSLCARLLLSRTSHRMARSWFARALSVAQRFEKKEEEMIMAHTGGKKSVIKTRLCWFLFGRLLAHKINSILSLLND